MLINENISNFVFCYIRNEIVQITDVFEVHLSLEQINYIIIVQYLKEMLVFNFVYLIRILFQGLFLFYVSTLY